MPSEERANSEGRLCLSDIQQSNLLSVACELVAAAVHRQPISIGDLPLGDLGAVSVVGVFVTLRKQGNLRGCIGNFTEAIRLDAALERAAKGVACHDPRFPPVQPDELPQLTIEVSLLHSRELLSDDSDERLASVEIGQHGLDIQYLGRAGLLLPSVPIDHDWDALTFLSEVCRKAGLPLNAWQSPQASLFRFSSTRYGRSFLA
ncbi:MAG: AmmeMemoRadiSam system protein A [Pirellulaceae bacterium]